jgi:uncharacterized protein
MSEVDKKRERLEGLLVDMGGVVIAYSGGVDSTLLLKAAHDCLGERALAAIGRSKTMAQREFEFAVDTARSMGARFKIVETNELGQPSFSSNPPDRCHLCKSELFSKLGALAASEGLPWVADGSNLDDCGDYRPGLRAAKEMGVRSPLIEAGMTKEDIRELSKALGLTTWDKPSKACLSSRFPFGTEITRQKLAMVEEAENFLLDLGFKQVRVRHHGEIARVEVEKAEIERLLNSGVREKVVSKLKSLGFKYITLDLAGYSSGSFNPRSPVIGEERG